MSIRKDGKSMSILNNKSFCPECLDIVESGIMERDGKNYLDIYCPKHGKSENLHKWDDPRYYKAMNIPGVENIHRYPTGLLIDTNFDCNQDCAFCFADANERKDPNPTLEEIIKKVDDFRGIYIFLGGGEPTLRVDLPIIIRELKKRKFTIVLLTNGKKLADISYVKELKDAGLDIVQLQFDTMDDSQYEVIRKEKLLDLKLKVVSNLKEAHILIYLWAGLIKGLNDNQVRNIISFGAENSDVVKIVFFVPMWLEGKTAEHKSITIKEIIKIFHNEYNMDEDAFMDYVKFDFYASLLYRRFTNKLFFKYQPCTVSYYLFYINKSVILLSDIIDLKKFNCLLECLHRLLTRKGFLKGLNYFFKISTLFFIKDVVLNKKARLFICMLLRTLFLHILLGKPPMIKDHYSFQVRIEGLFDKYNSDFNMLEHCNLLAYCDDEIMPFCQREIARKKHLK